MERTPAIQPMPVGDNASPRHPRHPGVGHSTSLLRLEGNTPEVGGFIVFFPSGRHLNLVWNHPQQIQPTKEAAFSFTGRLVDELNKLSADGDKTADEDLARTNWVSVAAAVQRQILDFNDAISKAIGATMAEQALIAGVN